MSGKLWPMGTSQHPHPHWVPWNMFRRRCYCPTAQMEKLRFREPSRLGSTIREQHAWALSLLTLPSTHHIRHAALTGV